MLARQRFAARCKHIWAMVASIVCLCVMATLPFRPRPLLLWNASASSPVGLYAVVPVSHPRRSDTIVAWAPLAARRMADARHYVPFAIPLVKRVGATAGDRVCAHGATIVIDGRPSARRRRHDPAGRAMPWWTGCRRLRPGETFLLSATGALAFDGRYFGITRRDEIVGKARLLWPG